jgi:hypothetical protein
MEDIDTDRKNLGTMEELMEGGSPERYAENPELSL